MPAPVSKGQALIPVLLGIASLPLSFKFLTGDDEGLAIGLALAAAAIIAMLAVQIIVLVSLMNHTDKYCEMLFANDIAANTGNIKGRVVR